MVSNSDFLFDKSKNQVICPNGCKSDKVRLNNAKKNFIGEFKREICRECKLKPECPVKLKGTGYIFAGNMTIEDKPQSTNTFECKENSLGRLEYFEQLYYEANKLADMGITKNHSSKYMDEAEKIYISIINEPEILPFTGGAYVNLADIRIQKNYKSFLENGIKNLKKFGFKIEEDETLESYYKKALEIKPTNQYALNGLAKYYFLTQNFGECYSYYKKIENIDDLKYVLESITNIDINYEIYLKTNSLDKLKSKDRIQFYEKIFHEVKNTPYVLYVGYLLARYCKLDGQLLKGYEVAKFLVDSFPDLDLGYVLIVEFCHAGYLNRPNELIEYGNRGLKVLDKMFDNKDKQIDKDIEDSRIHIISQIATAFIALKKYEDAVLLLDKQTREHPNNTDFHNLSEAYYQMGKYDLALNNINKALYYYEDEMSLYLLGKIYRARGQIKEAIQYIKRAEYFIENEEMDFSVIKDNLLFFSYAPKEGLEGNLQGLYEELIPCYISEKDFASAYALNKLALDKWRDVECFRNYGFILDRFIDTEQQNQMVSEKLKEIAKEKEEERKLYKERIGKINKWAYDLLNIQNDIPEESEKMESRDFWLNYEKHMEQIIKQMSECSNVPKVTYSDIENQIKEKYYKLNHKALTCLTTAEFLYEVNKHSIIDFAPIVVEYTKVFEIELNKILKLSPYKTMGELIYYLSKLNNLKWNKIIDTLESLRKIRNGSAHTGLSTKDKVEKIRKIFFEDGWLDYLLERKQEC